MQQKQQWRNRWQVAISTSLKNDKWFSHGIQASYFSPKLHNFQDRSLLHKQTDKLKVCDFTCVNTPSNCWLTGRNSQPAISKTFLLYPLSYIFFLSKQMLHTGGQGPWLDKRPAMSFHPLQQWPRAKGNGIKLSTQIKRAYLSCPC